ACADCADYVSHTFNGVPNPTTATLIAGQSYTVSYTYKNTGTNTWSCCTPWPSYHPYYQQGKPPQGVKAAPVNRRPDIDNLENTVNPVYANHTAPSTPTNGLETFTWNHTAPTTPGTYEFVPAVLRDFVTADGSTYFSGYAPTVIVTVVPNTQYALNVTKAGNGVGT